MILGIGADILDKRRLLPENLSEGDPFVQRTFTEKEIAQANARPVPRDYYATRFAGKEAVSKALRASPEGARMSDIEILDDENGAPYCVLSGKLLAHAEARGGTKVHVSLSWDGDHVLAFAIFESNEA